MGSKRRAWRVLWSPSVGETILEGHWCTNCAAGGGEVWHGLVSPLGTEVRMCHVAIGGFVGGRQASGRGNHVATFSSHLQGSRSHVSSAVTRTSLNGDENDDAGAYTGRSERTQQSRIAKRSSVVLGASAALLIMTTTARCAPVRAGVYAEQPYDGARQHEQMSRAVLLG